MLLTGDPMADADHDGFTALLEYALGTSDANPNDVSGILHFDAAGLPVLPEVPAGRDSAILTLERSADMQSWVPQERGQPLPANSRWFVRARATLW
jgi:hypothetical protein